MIKIPFIFYFDGNKDEPDWESLGIPKPEDEDTETKIRDVYVLKKLIRMIEPNIEDDQGSYISIHGEEISWKCPLEPSEVHKLIEG